MPAPLSSLSHLYLTENHAAAMPDFNIWTPEMLAFHIQACCSVGIDNISYIKHAASLVVDYLSKSIEEVTTPYGKKTTALKVGGRADFINMMSNFMIVEGMANEEDFPSVNQKDVRDIRSHARLSLIFETHVKQTFGFRQWMQGNTPAVRDAFPASRLVREVAVNDPRPRHQAHLGKVYLKDDPIWANYFNDPLIGGFGVPWGPYGFNSGVNQEDVSRAEAEREGLKVPSYVNPQTEKTIIDGTKASTKTMDPDLKKRLLDELRAGPTVEDGFRQAALAGRGQGAYAPNRGLNVVVDGDSIRTR